MSEVQPAAHERNVIGADPAHPREHQRHVAHPLDHNRGRRPPVTAERLDLEPLELGLRVPAQLLVQQLLVDPRHAVQNDHASAGVRHRGQVADELDVVDAVPQSHALRAPRRLPGSTQELVRGHMLNLL